MFAKDDAAGTPELGGIDCLVALRVTQNPRDVDTKFMGKGSRANDGFRGWNWPARAPRDKLRERGQLGEIHARPAAGYLRKCGHYFFQRSIACPLPETENTDARMCCSSANGGKGVRCCKTKIVMAMKLQLDSGFPSQSS